MDLARISSNVSWIHIENIRTHALSRVDCASRDNTRVQGIHIVGRLVLFQRNGLPLTCYRINIGLHCASRKYIGSKHLTRNRTSRLFRLAPAEKAYWIFLLYIFVTYLILYFHLSRKNILHVVHVNYVHPRLNIVNLSTWFLCVVLLCRYF